MKIIKIIIKIIKYNLILRTIIFTWHCLVTKNSTRNKKHFLKENKNQFWNTQIPCLPPDLSTMYLVPSLISFSYLIAPSLRSFSLSPDTSRYPSLSPPSLPAWSFDGVQGVRTAAPHLSMSCFCCLASNIHLSPVVILVSLIWLKLSNSSNDFIKLWLYYYS